MCKLVIASLDFFMFENTLFLPLVLKGILARYKILIQVIFCYYFNDDICYFQQGMCTSLQIVFCFDLAMLKSSSLSQ